MKDEIKEILNYFRKYATIRENTMLSEIEDYITNLQQKYQDTINQSIEDHKYASKKEDEALDYKSRNEKAKIEISELFNRYLFEEDFYIEDFHLDKVLKTLDGRSDE